MSTLGIDLGTTNTVVAKDGAVLPLDPDGGALMPSVVAHPPSGATLVGYGAQRRRIIDPANTIFSAKRLIGRAWISEQREAFGRRYPVELVEVSGAPRFRTRAGAFSPVEIGSAVLSAAARCAEFAANDDTVVVTVPSMFGDSHRQATLEAARGADLGNVEIINEPMAVARAYLARANQQPPWAAVYDFGGGTFDLAIVDCRKEPFEVICHGGDVYLGGDDIDQRLAVWAADEILRRHRWDVRSDRAVYARLVVECERAKIRLCDSDTTDLEMTRVDPAAPEGCRSLTIDSAVPDELARDLVRRSFIICDETLHRAGLTVDQLGAVLPAGGSTLLPSVKRGVEAYFRQPVEHRFDAMQVVAIGASLPSLAS